MVANFFYGENTLLLDTCCNSGVTNLKGLLTTYWKDKSMKSSNTLGGAYNPPYAAKSDCFGAIAYDPNLPFTVLSYQQQRIMGYVKPTSKDGSKFLVGFPTHSGVVEIPFSFIDGMLIGDGSKLMECYENYNCFT